MMTIPLYTGWLVMASTDAPLDQQNVLQYCAWCCNDDVTLDEAWYGYWNPDYSGEDDLVYHVWVDHLAEGTSIGGGPE
jgi:hypothetical protein